MLLTSWRLGGQAPLRCRRVRTRLLAPFSRGSELLLMDIISPGGRHPRDLLTRQGPHPYTSSRQPFQPLRAAVVRGPPVGAAALYHHVGEAWTQNSRGHTQRVTAVTEAPCHTVLSLVLSWATANATQGPSHHPSLRVLGGGCPQGVWILRRCRPELSLPQLRFSMPRGGVQLPPPSQPSPCNSCFSNSWVQTRNVGAFPPADSQGVGVGV